MSDEDTEGIDRDNPWHASSPPTKKKLFAYDWANGYVSPWRPTPDAVLARLVSFLGKKTKESDCIMDMGCGDGRVLCRLAKELPYVRGVGVDLDDNLLREAAKCAADMGVSDRVVFHQEDITATDATEAAVIICYLLPDALALIRDSVLMPALRRGTIVISVKWRIPGWGSEYLHVCDLGVGVNNLDVCEIKGCDGDEQGDGSEGVMDLDAMYAQMGFYCCALNS